MGDRSDIEWTDATWNPVRGCRRVSPGCVNCYAERVAARFSGPGQPYEGLARMTASGPRWTGVVRLVPEHLADPLRWKKPRRVFVNSMSDLFHEGLSNEDIAAVFGIMAAAPQHTFQVLTKRPERMREWFRWIDDRIPAFHSVFPNDTAGWIARHLITNRARHAGAPHTVQPRGDEWPLPNVWLGVSVEEQATADERIPLLLETPSAVRFVSYEPALGPVDFTRFVSGRCLTCDSPKPRLHPAVQSGGEVGICPDAFHSAGDGRPRLDWIIAGSESGPRARPAELEWFRSVRDQCAAAGVSFFFKQWVGVTRNGEADDGATGGFERGARKVSLPVLDGHQHAEFPR